MQMENCPGFNNAVDFKRECWFDNYMHVTLLFIQFVFMEGQGHPLGSFNH
jgi:hypothetical protein